MDTHQPVHEPRTLFPVDLGLMLHVVRVGQVPVLKLTHVIEDLITVFSCHGNVECVLVFIVKDARHGRENFMQVCLFFNGLRRPFWTNSMWIARTAAVNSHTKSETSGVHEHLRLFRESRSRHHWRMDHRRQRVDGRSR